MPPLRPLGKDSFLLVLHEHMSAGRQGRDAAGQKAAALHLPPLPRAAGMAPRAWRHAPYRRAAAAHLAPAARDALAVLACLRLALAFAHFLCVYCYLKSYYYPTTCVRILKALLLYYFHYFDARHATLFAWQDNHL